MTRGAGRRGVGEGAPHRLLNLLPLAPDVRYEQGVTVAPDRVLQAVGELCLSVRHVVAVAVRQRDDGLLEERERLVDVHRLLHVLRRLRQTAARQHGLSNTPADGRTGGRAGSQSVS